MNITNLDSQQEDWDSFVMAQDDGRGPHLSRWKNVIERSFGHQCHYLIAQDHDRIQGVLPLVHLQSRLFGSFLISVPFLNYGGAIATSAAAFEALLRQAESLAKRLGVDHIEYRSADRKVVDAPTKQHKVAMVLELPATPDELWKAFKAKLRSQIRKPMKSGMTVRIGEESELESFYQVFSINMRDLGTPVYSKRFFQNILQEFPDQAWICTVYSDDKPCASGLLFGFRDMLEIPWASSLRAYNRLAPNMLLYWSVLEFAIQRGFKRFDFGRSTPNEGTYKFKEQWGAKPVPLHWQYWLSNGNHLPDLSPANGKYQLAIRLWQKLPLAITRVVGPAIVKNIP